MAEPHKWSTGAPGIYCLRCGRDSVLELAIACPDCYVPCDEEEMARDPLPRLCPQHQAYADVPCLKNL
jgi:hypothetical protein